MAMGKNVYSRSGHGVLLLMSQESKGRRTRGGAQKERHQMGESSEERECAWMRASLSIAKAVSLKGVREQPRVQAALKV